MPKPILVKFKAYEDKRNFYEGRKKLKDFQGDGSKIHGARRIFINEHLTVERKRLYAQAREKGKMHKWFRVSTFDGKIFVKVSKEQRAVMVTKEADLEELYG